MKKYEANPVIVDAAVILAVTEKVLRDGKPPIYTVVFDNEMGAPVAVELDRGMTARMAPIVGDYYVRQSDGYVYINPKAVFKRMYHELVN
jgi:hypothetical protein